MQTKRPVAEYNHVAPVAVKTYGYRTLPAPAYAPEPAPEPAYVYQEEPIVVPEPEPVVRSAPVRSAPAPFVPYQPEPAPFVPYQPEPEPPAAVVRSAPLPVHPVFHQERAAYAAFMPVPAVPEDQFNQYQAVNYMAGPTLPPALAPAPPAQAFSRAAEIVPVFNNEIPQVRPKNRLEHDQITTYLVQLKIFKRMRLNISINMYEEMEFCFKNCSHILWEKLF